jgi:hypothetical protein
MILEVERVQRNLELIRHGGEEAIFIFMNMCRSVYDHGGEDSLLDWITLAVPSLPEKERAMVMTALMAACFSVVGERKKPQRPAQMRMH